MSDEEGNEFIQNDSESFVDDNIGNRLPPEEQARADTLPEDEVGHPYDSLTPDAVIDAVESTGRLSDARILALNSYENRVYQVGMEQGEPVIAKFYRPQRWSTEQIVEEHEYTQRLFDLDIPVVPPLVINVESETPTLATHGDFSFALYPRQGGRAPELDNLDHLFHLGQFIGRIHLAGSSYHFCHRLSLNTSRMGDDSVSFLLEHNFIPADLRPAYEAVAHELLAGIKHAAPDGEQYKKLSLHGDCHPGNILWRDDRPHFVDFDDAMTGPAIQDLWMLLSGDAGQQERQLCEIVEGYEEFSSFDSRELALVEPLRALRVLHYSAWLARRWDDPAFPLSFPWFNTARYWSEHILELKELLSALQEPPLRLL